MDDETRAAFARIDRYFELSQAQHLELRQDIARLDGRLAALTAEFRTFRDWVTARFAELRTTVLLLIERLDDLERRPHGPVG
jgi:hypothetical protein